MLAEQGGVKAIGFMDDNFLWNEGAHCRHLRHNEALQYGVGLRGTRRRHNRADSQDAGRENCRYIDLGIESFDDAIPAYIKKGIKSEDIYRAIGLLKKYGVPVKLNGS